MEDNNINSDVQEQPAQDEPLQEDAQDAEQSQQEEQPEREEVSDEQPSEQQPESDGSNESQSQSQTDDYDYLSYQNYGDEVPQEIKLEDLPRDTDGSIDPKAFQDWMAYNQQRSAALAQQAARQEFAALQAEKREWESIEKQWPEVKTNPELKKMIHNQRVAEMVSGGKGSLSDAAQSVQKHMGKIRSEATTNAKQSITRQKAAHLETSNVTSNKGSSRRQELQQRIESGSRKESESARLELLSDMIERGELGTNQP